MGIVQLLRGIILPWGHYVYIRLPQGCMLSSEICGLQRIKGKLYLRFDPTNLRIVHLKEYLRKLKYFHFNTWIKQ
jgi:hypothetical protein